MRPEIQRVINQSAKIMTSCDLICGSNEEQLALSQSLAYELSHTVRSYADREDIDLGSTYAAVASLIESLIGQTAPPELRDDTFAMFHQYLDELRQLRRDVDRAGGVGAVSEYFTRMALGET